MLFNSQIFLFFFFIVTLFYYLLPHRYRWQLLLAASSVFYMWFIPKYILILLITIVIDFVAGILIENTANQNKRKIYLIFSIISTCLVLVVFKYYNFFSSNINSIAHILGWNYSIKILEIILPIGLSFHTFQSLSYVIEVYRKNQKAERHFGIYALYVMFYPQLVAGPIERPQNLLHQFYEKHSFHSQSVLYGLKLMAWGMFKKIIIADRLSIFVRQNYENVSGVTGFSLWLATIFFAFQIYCDFSGYSEIAQGAAKVMGFRLMDNFNRPYFSKSVSEFWKRWHVSLSTWFKDYLYISLGGNKVSKFRWNLNLFITFLVSGLWHGANWTYIIWGALNGMYLIFANLFSSKVDSSKSKIINIWHTIFTFKLICFSWIFFRAASVQDAFIIIRKIFNINEDTYWNFNMSASVLCFNVLLILFLLCVEYYQKSKPLFESIATLKPALRFSFYYFIIFSLIYLRPDLSGPNSFIYFQF